MVNEFEATLDRVVERLSRLNIEYMICGSVASSHYGESRSTHDIDVVVALSFERLTPLAEAFGEGFYFSDVAAREALQRHSMFNVVDFETGIKVDLIVLKDAPFEREEFARRRTETLAGRQVQLISPEDSMLSKLLWNQISPSERQLRDVQQIGVVQGDRLDRVYLERWAAQLGIKDQLDKVFPRESSQ